MGKNEERLKIEESFKMVMAIADLLGYGLAKSLDGNYCVLDTKDKKVGSAWIGEYKRSFLGWLKQLPKYGDYSIYIDDDRYHVCTDQFFFDKAPLYSVDIKDNKNSVALTLENGALWIALHVPGGGLDRTIPNLWLNDSSFRIESDDRKVAFDGETYTTSDIKDGQVRIITVQEFRDGIKIEETIGNIPQKPKFIEGQTLTDYISNDMVGITLLSQYDCIYSQFSFDKTLKEVTEVVGEDAFESSGLSLLYEQIEKEKKLSTEQKILILKDIVRRK